MRTVNANSRQFNIRPLTRREVKRLKSEHGINLLVINRDNADQAMDLVLELVLSESELEALEDLPYSMSLDIWNAALSETFGSKDEEKNSSRSGTGSQTASG